MKWFLALGSVFGFLGVALGAFAAHGLESRLSERMLEVFKTGVTYQMYHALALILVGVLGARLGGRLLDAAGWSFVIGVVLFSGSLYVLAVSGISRFGMITPFGGVAFLIGWTCLFFAIILR